MNNIADTLILDDLEMDLSKGLSRSWTNTLRSIGRVATRGMQKVAILRDEATKYLDILIDVFYPKSYKKNNRTMVKVHMSKHPEMPSAFIGRTEDGFKVILEKTSKENTVFTRDSEGNYSVDTRGDGSTKEFKSLPYKTQITLSLLVAMVGHAFATKRQA